MDLQKLFSEGFTSLVNEVSRLAKQVETLELEVKALKETPPPPPAEKEFISASEAAEYLGYTKATIYQKTNNREIPYYQTGNNILFKKEELRAWLEAHKRGAKTDMGQKKPQ